ncbi:piggyBac transposable element-derived protein 4-like [Amphiura filiformis]|uniref:piggyBac transposable element-derived protein 4-like n=1 Tax=Amphiura filiformis TaxID=82378 RepID=UPI003B20EAA7
MVEWTNSNLAVKGKRLTSIDEINAWLGIVLVMGVVNLNNRIDYWSTNLGLRNMLISRTMSLGRFELLSSNLGCCARINNPDLWPTRTSKQRQHQYNKRKKYPTYPVKPVWDEVLNNCKTKFLAKQDLAIDEAMIAYKGFKSFVHKVFMPMKPTRVGFKAYSLAESESGFMLNFFLHQPSKTPQKMADIAYRVVEPFLNLYHHM